jgi:hypothetical protein
MSREVRRVDLNFDWFERYKLNGGRFSKTWKGFVLDTKLECFLCNGTGTNLKNEICSLCEGQKYIVPRFEPPKHWDDKKNGFQIWEDVSEGSPVSPVFKKAEDLAKWMVNNDDSITRGTSYSAWLRMIKELGSCPSGVLVFGGEIKNGMSLYEKKEKKK